MNIVSLLPAASEWLVALGFENQLLGRSHACDYPSSLLSLPACSQPAMDVSGDSAAIDRAVKARLQQGLSLFEVDFERLGSLQPELVVTQDQCQVCAVSLAELEQALQEKLKQSVELFSLNPSDLGEIWNDVRRLAQRLQVPDKGDRLIFQLQQRMARIAAQAFGEPRKVVCLEWLNPLMTAGHWTPELVEMAGGEPVLSQQGRPSEVMSWQQLLGAQPDVLVLMPCGFDTARSLQEMPQLTAHPQWQELKAVQQQQVYIADGNHYFNRPGPRLVESLEILAEILLPDVFDFGHRGTAWMLASH